MFVTCRFSIHYQPFFLPYIFFTTAIFFNSRLFRKSGDHIFRNTFRPYICNTTATNEIQTALNRRHMVSNTVPLNLIFLAKVLGVIRGHFLPSIQKGSRSKRRSRSDQKLATNETLKERIAEFNTNCDIKSAATTHLTHPSLPFHG